jgi:hypothetical protein
MHLFVTLDKDSKMITPEDVDKHISAQLPDENEDSLLFGLIAKIMMHGPCDQRCLVNGECSKRFPKEFCEETTFNTKGYPSYARPDNGRHVYVKETALDNRSVVAHCIRVLVYVYIVYVHIVYIVYVYIVYV